MENSLSFSVTQPELNRAEAKASIRDLKDLMAASKPFAVDDVVRSTFHLLSTTAIFAACAVAAGMMPYWPLRLLFSVLAGLVAVRLFIIYHDYRHGAVFKRKSWQGRFLNLWGALILNPPAVWDRSHNYHHQHNAQIATASIGSFPIMTVAQYKAASPALRLKYRLARHPLTILLGYVTVFLIGMCGKSFFTDMRRHWDSAFALVLHFAIMATLVHFGGWPLAFFALILPTVIACTSGAYLFYIQHNFPEMELKPRQDWDYAFAALKSSSFMDGSKVMHWFTGNIGYHHVHHLNARIPFYKLPEAMAAIPELQNPGRTTLSPRDIYRCLSLKLWDAEKRRMLTFNEASL